jgi:hypothetical protein
MSPDQWTPGRLNDQFATLRDELRELRADAKQVPTLAVRLGYIEERVDSIQDDVKEYIGRAVTLRLVLVATPLFIAALVFTVGVFTGRIG